jgi:hypothetical protein
MVNSVGTPAHVLALPKWVFAIHAAQAFFAIIILGLDAYGIHYIAYNALIYSLVVCICTLLVCAYLLASQLTLHKLYNIWIALAFHAWMLLFWIVDLGLHANLARIWSGDYSYGYDYYYTSYYGYRKRDVIALSKREDTTTYAAYHGALAAGATFAGVEFVSWVAVSVIFLIKWNKHRQNTANSATTPATQPPPQYGAPTDQAVPMEKYNHTAAPVQQQQMPQQQYAQPVQQQQPQQQYMQQPQQPQQQYMQPQQQPHYPQQPQQQQHQHLAQPQPAYADPVGRQDNVSPVSSAAYGAPPSNVSELNSPQHTGSAYPPNASELSSQQAGTYLQYNPDVPELSDRK